MRHVRVLLFSYVLLSVLVLPSAASSSPCPLPTSQNSPRYQFFNLLKSDPARPVGITGRRGCSIWLPISSRPTPLACTGLLTTSPRPVTCCGMPTRTGICSISSASSTTPSIRSEEHTSELQSLMRISYAVFCLKKQKTTNHNHSYIVN